MRIHRKCAAPLIALCLMIAVAAPALAETPGPGWEVNQGTYPSSLAPGGSGQVVLAVYNVGSEASSGPVTVTDRLPAGVTATEAGYYGRSHAREHEEEGPLWKCSTGTVVTCTNDPADMPSLPPGEIEWLEMKVHVPAHPSGATLNEVVVAGGGASQPAAVSSPLTLSTTHSSFGFQRLDGWFSGLAGTLNTQAGSHPYALTLSFFLNNTGIKPTHQARNITVNLPPGLVGNPTAVPRCTRPELDLAACPADTQVGVDEPVLDGPGEGGEAGPIEEGQAILFALRFPVYNVVPPPGVAAQFAFTIFGITTFLDATVRTGGDYGITVHTNNITQKEITFNSTTIWGVPGESSHDFQRCQPVNGLITCGLPARIGHAPFLTLPTSCSGPQTFSATTEPWEALTGSESMPGPSSFLSHDQSGEPAGITGCDKLGFAPALTAVPDTVKSDTPAGLSVEVRPPLGALQEFESRGTAEGAAGLGTSDIQNTTVTLPQGLVINPGQAAGLQACTRSQAALEDLPGGGENDGPPSCPNASKVGTVTIASPLVEGATEKQFEGSVYLLQSDPPELKLLVAASADGVNLKLVGTVHLDERTGQLTTKFEGTPELPFTLFKLSFSGGAQAALDTPTQCGSYQTDADFTPWSSPFVPDFFTSASFGLSQSPDGGACPSGPLPFSPSLIAGATTDQAGGFTDFSLLLQRGDGQQRISGLQFKAPAGLTGFLAKVPLCTNAQAEADACPQASKIGHTVVESGPGPYPLVVPEPGQPAAPIYLTESYAGAPFGLSIVVPLHVGPFTLPTQRVRARIEIDPATAALTVTTDPLPQVVAGVPTDLREVNAVIERPEFMVNPTSCEPQQFAGTAYGTPPAGAGGPGAQAAISSRFQVGDCAALKFQPKFTVSTSGRTSRVNGASLTAKVTYPATPQGTEANIGSVKVELPKRLPSRLSTLQKACTSAQFQANPASCPAASFVGRAVVHTPLLPVPLTGPAIFVSHGGEAFPSLTIVLQGDGVTIDLLGTTFISKAGITSTTFKTVPDEPFSSFELTLPEGPYSALAAPTSLCTGKLAMPTTLTAQNGATLKQATHIQVTGCTKHVKKIRRAKRRKSAHTRR